MMNKDSHFEEFVHSHANLQYVAARAVKSIERSQFVAYSLLQVADITDEISHGAATGEAALVLEILARLGALQIAIRNRLHRLKALILLIGNAVPAECGDAASYGYVPSVARKLLAACTEFPEVVNLAEWRLQNMTKKAEVGAAAIVLDALCQEMEAMNDVAEADLDSLRALSGTEAPDSLCC